jgi:hypothetical protein
MHVHTIRPSSAVTCEPLSTQRQPSPLVYELYHLPAPATP